MKSRLALVAAAMLGLALLMAGPAAATPPTLTWSAPAAIGVSQLVGLSCPARGFCVAVGGNGDVSVLHGTSWSAPRHVASALVSVSCPTTSYCIAVNGSQFLVYNSGNWSPPHAVGGYDVSCPSTVFCMAVSQSGTYSTFDGAVWSAAQQVPNNEFGDGMNDVTCPSSSLCLGDDVDGVLYGIRGSIVGGGGTVAGQETSQILCTSAAFCASLDPAHPRAVWRHNSAPWTHVSLAVPTGHVLTGLSCNYHAFCAAVDDNGDVFTLDDTSFSGPHRVITGAGGASAIDCVSSYYCVMIGRSGQASIGTR